MCLKMISMCGIHVKRFHPPTMHILSFIPLNQAHMSFKDGHFNFFYFRQAAIRLAFKVGHFSFFYFLPPVDLYAFHTTAHTMMRHFSSSHIALRSFFLLKNLSQKVSQGKPSEVIFWLGCIAIPPLGQISMGNSSFFSQSEVLGIDNWQLTIDQLGFPWRVLNVDIWHRPGLPNDSFSLFSWGVWSFRVFWTDSMNIANASGLPIVSVPNDLTRAHFSKSLEKSCL